MAVTAPNISVSEATYAVTIRCTLRKLFLTPLTPRVHSALLYAACLAAQKCGVEVHHLVFMPNHIHVTASTGSEANISRFRRLFFGEAGKLMKVLLAEHDFEPPEQVFSSGSGHHMRLVGGAAQMTWLHYEDINVINAGLVARVEDYPGFSMDLGLMNGGVLVAKRPPVYFDRRHSPSEIVLPCRAPADATLAMGSAEKVVYELRKLRELKERALAESRTRPVLGALAVTRQHPWGEPSSPRTFRDGPRKSFMVVGDELLRIQCALETKQFRERYRECREQWLDGDREVEFPYGTNAMRTRHGANVEPVETTADRIVSRPGPLHAERLSEPERRELRQSLRERASTVTPDELTDTLAERLEESRNVERDRRAGPAQLAAAPSPKVVVLRNSTATARRRRRRRDHRQRIDRPDSFEDADTPFDPPEP